jgi:hypothetical protein
MPKPEDTTRKVRLVVYTREKLLSIYHVTFSPVLRCESQVMTRMTGSATSVFKLQKLMPASEFKQIRVIIAVSLQIPSQIAVSQQAWSLLVYVLLYRACLWGLAWPWWLGWRQ